MISVNVDHGLLICPLSDEGGKDKGDVLGQCNRCNTSVLVNKKVRLAVARAFGIGIETICTTCAKEE